MFLGEVHFDLRGRACGSCGGRFGRQAEMAKNLLNHCFLRYKTNNFHYLAAVRAFERHDLKDASHQKCPHYRGLTIRVTVRPAISLLFDGENSPKTHNRTMDSGSARNRRPRFRIEGIFGKRIRRNSGLDTRRGPLHGGRPTRSPGFAEPLERGWTAGGFWACRSRWCRHRVVYVGRWSKMKEPFGMG
jgi:hypothetical protein